LDRSVFKGANLIKANLSGVHGKEVGFSDADLSQALLIRAHLMQCDFSNARMDQCLGNEMIAVGACMDGVKAGKPQFNQADFSETSWIGANIEQAVMAGVDLSGADCSASHWTRTAMPNVKAPGSNWSGSSLDQLHLIGGAQLSESCFRNCRARACGFRAAVMRGADLSQAQIQECDFGECDLSGAFLTAALMRRCLFMAASLEGADMRQANFFQSLCRKTDFTLADMRGAGMVQADMSLARFKSTRLENCRGLPGEDAA